MYRDNEYKEDTRSVAQKMADIRKKAQKKEKLNTELHTQKIYPKILLEIERMSTNKCGATPIEHLLKCLSKDKRDYVCWETLIVLLREDGFLVHALRNCSGNLTTNSSVTWGEEIVLLHSAKAPKLNWWGKFKLWMSQPAW